jgi:hypothetical protein
MLFGFKIKNVNETDSDKLSLSLFGSLFGVGLS